MMARLRGMKFPGIRVVQTMKTCAFLAATVLAAAPVRAATPILEVSQVHAGQKGYGLSDFGDGQGVRPFDVEILGVLRDFAPKQDLILARLSGCGLEKSGIIAGMSGSPVYVDGRLVGAVAYGWPFSREPIAGITPIAAMLDIRHLPANPPVPIGAPAPQGERRAAAALAEDLQGPRAVADFRSLVRRVFPPAAPNGSWAPLALPVSAPSGAFAGPLFHDLLGSERFVASPAGGAAARGRASHGLEPGSSVATILISGDMTLAATGTVTWVDDPSVLAFGHPFLSMGPVEMPMAGSTVVGVLPSLYRSFKFASTGTVLGSITQDRSTGILGSFGSKAVMVPLTLSIASENLPVQTYEFKVVSNSMLTPILTAIAIDTTLSTLEKSAGERTLVWKSSIRTPGRTIHFDSVFSGISAKEQAVATMALLTNYLMANEFRDLAIEGIDVSIVHSDELKNARITKVELDRDRVHPGETVGVTVTLQDFRGQPRQLQMEMPIPKSTPPGPVTVFLGDGASATAFDLALFPARPQSLDQVLDFLDRLRPANTVNLLAYRPANGAVVAGEELAALPPSMFSLMVSRGSDEGAPRLSQQRIFSKSIEQPIPVSGSARFTIHVDSKTD
jgi:hypothetical protein